MPAVSLGKGRVDGWMGGWVDGWMDGWTPQRHRANDDAESGNRCAEGTFDLPEVIAGFQLILTLIV